jgi:isoquinoline 1-oxidoreductase beta subunit
VTLRITRRRFLAGVGAATAGLALGVERIAAAGPVPRFAPNPFIQIGADGVVTIACHRSEMGQGIRSSLPVLMADELGADPARLLIVQGDADARYGTQETGGSLSIRGSWDAVRTAAATARTMLIAAAARRWRVPAAGLVARDDAVHDGARSLTFGELAVAASRLPIPKRVQLRPLTELRHVGTELPLRDGPDMVTGRALYAADVRLPGMLTAVVARPTAPFGKVARLDDRRALAVVGVRKVVQLSAPKRPIDMQALGGVAVIADNTWSAQRGRAALDIEWHAGPHAGHDSAAYVEELRAAVRTRGEVVRTVGDADAALGRAAHRLEAEYVVPYLVQAAMEPPAAVAQFTGGRCEIWACTQDPQAAQAQVATALGIDKREVTVHVTLLGGSFGRKLFPDFAIEAALLARAAGAPVRVQWTRDDDIRHSLYHAVSVQALAAGLDPAGKLVAWRHRVAYPSIMSTFAVDAIRPADFEVALGVTDLPLAVPNVRVETGVAPAHIRIGLLRSVSNIHQAFAIHSFIDELAHATKRDPRDTMIEVFGRPRILTAAGQGVPKLEHNYHSPLERTPFDVSRLHRVIEKVTRMAGWDAARAAGRAVGIAAHASFASWVALVVEVERGRRGGPRVREAWMAADIGIAVNPDRVRYQLEGSLIFALSNALSGAITVKGGAVQQSNFHDYKLLRMPDAPRAIHIELIPSSAPPGGAGEPGVPPVAPAVANAWFALTGQRVRTLPFLTRKASRTARR